MRQFLWICLGGALGTGLRYLLSVGALALWGPSFPYATLFVNSVGSFFIGVVNCAGYYSGAISPTLRVVLAAGVLGGFTTYSTFNFETLQYFQKGIWLMGLVNILSMVLVCLISGSLGFGLAKWIFG